MVTLRDALSRRDNGLNLVRLFLAGLVVVAHSWMIGGWPGNEFIGSLGPWAVYGFFAISGYLIAGSRLRLGWVAFITRRAVRILPGYWVCLLVTAFGAGPLLAVARRTDFDAATGLSFVRSNWWLWMSQLTIGNTLESAPVSWTINGSLWTLAFEALAYVLAGLLLGSVIVRQRLVTSSTVVFTSFVIAHAHSVSVGLSHGTQLALGLGGFFTAGMLLYAVSNRVLVNWRSATAATMLVLLFGVAAPSLELLALPLASSLLLCGAMIPVHWGAKNDYSYGVYIYAFPVQQLLAGFGMNHYGPWVFTVLSFVAVAPMAVLSWWFVEQPALRLAHHRRVQRPKAGSRGAAALKTTGSQA